MLILVTDVPLYVKSSKYIEKIVYKIINYNRRATTCTVNWISEKSDPLPFLFHCRPVSNAAFTGWGLRLAV